MVRILVLFLALFALPAHALTLSSCGVGNTVVANTCLSNTGLITLLCPIAGSGASESYSVCLNASDGSTAYTPSGATKFRAKAVVCNMEQVSVTGITAFGTSTQLLGSPFQNSSAPTSFTFFGGQEQYAEAPVHVVGHNESQVNWYMTNGKYMYNRASASTNGRGSCYVYGYEE